jgi:glycosyltransferase involved in cell wall biosynthesis
MNNYKIVAQKKKILIIAQHLTVIDTEVKYGALRATMEIAKYLASTKQYQIYVAGLSKHQSSFTNKLDKDIQYLFAIDKDSLESYFKHNIETVDILIQISDLNYINIIRAKKYIVYSHNPCAISLDNIPATRIINLYKIPVICVSNYSCQQQINYGISKNLVSIIPNGYDSSIFFYEELKYRHPFSIIFAGNIVDYKGVDIALKAFITIKEKFPDAVFNISGSNNSWKDIDHHYFKTEWLDPEGFPIWSKIELEISGVKYLGELSQSDLAEEFRQHSLLITPSRIGETFGLVSIEAQACGCIPILPYKGGFPETLQHGKTGYLYDDNNNTPEGISNTITCLWSQNLPTIEQRLNAKIWVEKKFSWENSGEMFLTILEKASEQKTSRILTVFLCFILEKYRSLRQKIKSAVATHKQGTLFKKLIYKISKRSDR